ncbi:hypothetical protein GF325_06890 [Candidatus Bathyarchaeota archaeon]|nr:hypothetical protein [Candidatus Bathyarchaeota archaeon]
MATEEDMKLFISEAEDLLQRIELEILKLEEKPADTSPFQELYFSFHSLKGMMAMVGLENTSKLCHSFETMLDQSKDKSFTKEKVESLVDLMFSTHDILHEVVQDVKTGNKKDIDEATVNEYETQLQGSDDAEHLEITFIKKIEKDEIDSILGNKKLNFYNIAIQIQSSCIFKKVRLFFIFRALNDIGQIAWSNPEPSKLETGDFDFDFNVFFFTTKKQEDIDAILEEILEIESKKYKQMDPDSFKPYLIKSHQLMSEGGKVSAPTTTRLPTGAAMDDDTSEEPDGVDDLISQFEQDSSQITSIKVDIETLEKLMDYFGELIVFKNQLSQTLSERADWEIGRVFDGMDKLFLEIQEIIFKLKLVRVSSTFRRYKRLVRDVSKETGKDVRFLLEGTDVELDRKILEDLNSPLIHIIRNAIYHGIESPDERERTGKPRRGTLKLSTLRKEGSVHIKVTDDGSGINYEKVRRKAVQLGELTEDQAETLSDKELSKIMFRPGFSTLSSADLISGRGMGLAIVADKIKELSGEIEIESTPGKGTTFTLVVPFSRAILKAQLLKIAGDLYAIPIENINQIYFFRRDLIEYVKGEEYYRLDDKLVPIIRLREYMDLADSTSQMAKPEEKIDLSNAENLKTREAEAALSEKIAILCKKDESNAVVFIVDEIFQQMDIVIKPFRSKFSGFQEVLGVTITGDGSICLIIDVLSIISNVSKEIKSLQSLKEAAPVQ